MPHGVGQAQVVDEAAQRLEVVEARGAPDQVEAGRRVVQAPVGPQRLDQFVLRLGRDDPPDEEDVGAAACLQRGQLGGHPRVGRRRPPAGSPPAPGPPWSAGSRPAAARAR